MTQTRRPGHAPIAGFATPGGCLHVGGVSLPRLADRVGGTPFYAYDRGLISERVAALRRHLPDGVFLHYAVKANPMPAVVQHMVGLVDGLDVASGGEMRVALDAPIAPADISFAGPGKSRDELAQAVAAGVLVNMESEREMRALAMLADATGITPRVAIRVNPDFELKAAGMRMSGGPRQFGVDAERVPAMLAELRGLNLEFAGFHVFSGSQNLKAEAIAEAQEKTIDLAARLADAAPLPVLNIGGGLGIP